MGSGGSYYQTRVSGACATGNSIRSINSDGSVICEPDDNTTYTAGNQLSLTGTTFDVVEGSGSGLDADLLDGQHGSYYATAAHDHWGETWSGAHLTNNGLRFLTTYADIQLTGSGYSFGIYALNNFLVNATRSIYGGSISPSGMGVQGEATATSGTTRGVGQVSSPSGTGVEGQSPLSGRLSIAFGTSGSVYGVYGDGGNTAGTNYGVYGTASTRGVGTGSSHGVYGYSSNSSGYGVYGYNPNTSGGRGVYGQGGTYGLYGSDNYGVYGSGNTGVHGQGSSYGVYGLGSNGVYGTGSIGVYDSGSSYAGYFNGHVHVAGNLTVAGGKASVVDTRDYGKRTLYAVESPENWFEDFGAAPLVNGVATVTIEPIFAQTVDLTEDYHVYVTAVCDEPVLLFVTSKTAASFTVRGVNLEGAASTCSFDYRIVAHRLGYEDLRLEPFVDNGGTP